MTELDSISLTDSAENDAQAVPQPLHPVQTLQMLVSALTTTLTSTTLHNSHFCRSPNWEKRLPNCFVVVSAISNNSLELSVMLQTTDTGEVFSTGATDQFMHSDFMKRNCITMRLLSWPISIYNVDGTPNEAGSITEVIEMML